jgi:hypothetical protein|tara:strand:- start:898 stop:2220 length:1323 start_codon:yes stop_codon:yes gene_type:complete
MIETLSILVHIFVITIFCYIPKYLLTFFNDDIKINIIDHLEIGIILNIFLLLILSFFFRQESNFIFYILLIVFLINLLFFIKDLINSIKLKKYLINPEFLLLLFLIFIFSVDLSSNLKLGWDAQNYWLVKKLVFSNGGSVFDLKNAPMPEYPYLGSFIWFIYSKISILNYEYFGRIFYIYLFLVSIFSVSKIIKIHFFEFLLLTLCIIFLIYKINLFSGYQEIINFSLLVILINNFYRLYNFKSSNYKISKKNILIIITMSILIWIKNESTVLILICLLSFLMSKQFKIDFKILSILFISGLLISKYFLFDYLELPHNIQTGPYDNLKFENLSEIITIERFLLISKHLIFGFFEMIIYFLSIILLIIMLKYNKIKRFNIFLLHSFIFSIIFLYSAYLLFPYPLHGILNISLNRLMFQTSGFFIITIPLFYNFFLKKYVQK